MKYGQTTGFNFSQRYFMTVVVFSNISKHKILKWSSKNYTREQLISQKKWDKKLNTIYGYGVKSEKF